MQMKTSNPASICNHDNYRIFYFGNIIHTEHLLIGFVVKGKVDTLCTHFISYWRQQMQESQAVLDQEPSLYFRVHLRPFIVSKMNMNKNSSKLSVTGHYLQYNNYLLWQDVFPLLNKSQWYPLILKELVIQTPNVNFLLKYHRHY